MHRGRPPISRRRRPKRSKEPWRERNSNGMQSIAIRSLLTSPIREVLREPPSLRRPRPPIRFKYQAQRLVPALPIEKTTRDRTACSFLQHNKRSLMAKPTRWPDTISTPIKAAFIASSKEQYLKASLPATLTVV